MKLKCVIGVCKYETIRHDIITEVKLTTQGRQCCSLGAVRAEGGRSREAKAELRSRPWHKITLLKVQSYLKASGSKGNTGALYQGKTAADSICSGDKAKKDPLAKQSPTLRASLGSQVCP